MPAPALPFENSYWVLEHRLLAGEFPGGRTETEGRERLRRLCQAGIDTFVDLTHEYELSPYAQWLPAGAEYTRSPIADTEVPERVEQMRQIQTGIRDSLAAGRNVYVHCRAGVGRTGVVVGCYLTEQGLKGRAALKTLNRLWQQSARSRLIARVPQTPEQADYIRRWRDLR